MVQIPQVPTLVAGAVLVVAVVVVQTTEATAVLELFTFSTRRQL
jgi:hypothetical protein